MMRILTFILLSHLPCLALEQRQVDFQALLNAETRFAEFQKIVYPNTPIPEPNPKQLENFHSLTQFIECPQRDGQAPLYVLLYQSFHDNWPFKPSFDSTSSRELLETLRNSGSYPHEEPPIEPTLTLQLPPNLNKTHSKRLAKPVLAFFDNTGLEHRIFGGNNMIEEGYLFDLNNDGILEKVDTTNWGVKDGYTVKSLTVKTVEHKPRTLLNILFEWHPDKFEEEHPWSYSCQDLDGDQHFEVILGPQTEGEQIKPVAIFSWNQDTGQYQQKNLPAGQDHFLILEGDQTWEKLKNLEAPLPYALEKQNKSETPKTNTDSTDTTSPEPKSFQPLDSATLSDEQLWKFMGSGRDHYQVERETFPETHFPENFWDLPPRDAAFALVEQNRNAKHRRKFKLFYTKDHLPCPESGWLVSRYLSDRSYTSITQLFAIHFGVDEPQLLVITSSSQGMVGARPLTDQTGYEIRQIPLDPKLATHLAQTTWYLDQIRSNPLEKSDHFGIGGLSTSADGHGSIYFYGDTNRTLTEATHWTVNTISERWQSDYDREVMFNFGNWLINKQLPIKLGNQWTSGNFSHHNLSTPEKEKLEPRHDPGTRQHLIEITRQLLKDQTIPPEFSAWLLEMVAEVGLADLKPDLDDFTQTLPSLTPPEEQLKALEEKFAATEEASRNDFNKQQELLKDPDYQELTRLRNQCHLFPTKIFVTPLAQAQENLALLHDKDALAKTSRQKNWQGNWALKQLQIHHPDLYRTFLEERFLDARNLTEKNNALSTIVHQDPDTALLLAPYFTPEQWKEFSAIIAPLIYKSAPEFAPELLDGLLALADSGEHGFSQRITAIKNLVPPKEPLRYPDERIDQLLARLAENPKNEQDRFVLQAVPRAVARALFLRNRHPNQWGVVMQRLSEKSDISADGFLDLLSIHLSRGTLKKQQVLTYLEERIENNHGRLETVFEIALANNLTELKPLLEQLATPTVDFTEAETTNQATSYSEPIPGDRFHRARHVLQIWHQEDPVQKFRTLTAFALQHPRLFTVDFKHYHHWTANYKQLLALAQSLPPEETKGILTSFRKQTDNPRSLHFLEQILQTIPAE